MRCTALEDSDVDTTMQLIACHSYDFFGHNHLWPKIVMSTTYELNLCTDNYKIYSSLYRLPPVLINHNPLLQSLCRQLTMTIFKHQAIQIITHLITSPLAQPLLCHPDPQSFPLPPSSRQEYSVPPLHLFPHYFQLTRP